MGTICHSKEHNKNNKNPSTNTNSLLSYPVKYVIGKYSVIQLCGKGHFAITAIAKLNESNLTYCDLYVLKYPIEANNTKAVEHLQKEENVLMKLSSNQPYIIKLIDTFIHDNIKYYVYPYYNIDMFNFIKLNKKSIPESIAKIILSQIYKAINSLHEHNIMFRDLKPENILIDVNTGQVKLIDFGFCVCLNNHDESISEVCGTNEYIPPEVVEGSKYGIEFDYWTFGILCYEMLYGEPPFKGSNSKEIMSNILMNELNLERNDKEVSDEVKDLLKYLLKKDKDERMEWENIPFHPWFKGTFDVLKEETNMKQGEEILKKYVEKFKDYHPSIQT